METLLHSAMRIAFDGLTNDIIIKYKSPPAYQIRIYLERCMLLEFSISEETIFISALHKCDGVSGSIMLDKIELFARTVGVKTISLNDASNIVIDVCDVKISLQTLYLLTAGMSWYNSKGYIDETLMEVKISQLIRTDDINVSMDIFMQKVITGLINNENYEYYKANKIFDTINDSQGKPTNYGFKLLSNINRIVRDLHIGLLVKDYFNIVKTLLKTPNPTQIDCNLFKLFEELIYFINESYILLKDLNGSTKILAGFKRRKTCKKCLKNKKHIKSNNKRKNKRGLILTFNLNDIK